MRPTTNTQPRGGHPLRRDGAARRLLAAALLAAALADAGPEIIASGSLAADYDGPGPLICSAAAALVLLSSTRAVPAAAAMMSLAFVIGGLADPGFRPRLGDPGDLVGFAAGWSQVLAFVVAAVLGAVVALHRPWGDATEVTQ